MAGFLFLVDSEASEFEFFELVNLAMYAMFKLSK